MTMAESVTEVEGEADFVDDPNGYYRDADGNVTRDDDEQESADPFDVDASTEAPEAKPLRAVFYGKHGAGKTTLLHHFPNVQALFTEEGWGALPIRRFPQVATTWNDVTRAIGSLIRKRVSGTSDRLTFGFDSLDWFEQIVWAETCRRHNIGNIEEVGYGKGYLLVDEVWAEFLAGLDALRDTGMHIVLLAHADVVKFSPPEDDPYDRYDLALHKRARALIHEWADVVGFCHEKTFTKTREEGTGKNKHTVTRATGAGGRFLALVGKPTHEAKNRYGLPDEISLSPDSSTADELLGRIAASFAV